MIQITEHKIIEAHAAAPIAIREWMASTRVASQIEQIAQWSGVAELAPSLAAITGYVLIGIVPVRDLANLLAAESSLPPEQTSRLAQEIRRQILAPVAHDLAALQPQAEQNYAQLQAQPPGSRDVGGGLDIQQGPPLPPTPPVPPQ